MARGGVRQAVQEHLVEQRVTWDGTSGRNPGQETGRHCLDGAGMMVQTRLWLAGEVSEQRDLPDPAAHRAGEALCGTASLLVCTDGLVSTSAHSGDLS